MTLVLESIDRDLLDGGLGAAAADAMDLLVRYAKVVEADRFVSIASAHIDGCLYHGPSSIDFVRRFVALGGVVRVPTTLNVAAVDTVHPGWHRGAPELIDAQSTLTDLHERLGCLPTLTCAPYQRMVRPQKGEHVAWAESNAIVFINSVLGARTDRYGDFTDLCAALTGRVPYAGLHRDENRRATLRVDIDRGWGDGLPRDLQFAALGYVVGRLAGGRVPVLTGLPDDTSEDEFKALGSAAASSGAVALFHAVGLTPEAATLDDASQGNEPAFRSTIGRAEIADAIQRLCPLQPGDPLAAMCVGTPHFSMREFGKLADLVRGRRAAPGVEIYVSTSREIAGDVALQPMAQDLAQFGVQIVVDTCTYLAPVVRAGQGAIVTNSAKWAHYGPGNLSRRVGLMALERCVRSAIAGKVVA